MFSFTDALHRGEQHHGPNPTEPDQRNSTYLPEKTEDQTSPNSAVSPNSTLSTRVPSPGLEPIRTDDETLKEATKPYVEPADKESYNHDPPPFKADTSAYPAQASQTEGKRRKLLPWIIAALALIVVLAIALGVGLGVGLKKKGSSKGSKASTLSTFGAFNGTGIALASESFDGSAFGSIVMYFQHHSGQIRSAQLSSDGTWQGGDATEVVAVDAKNGTPIAAVAYARNQTAAWHIFYINKGGTISEVTNSNTTNVWAPGPINQLNLKPLDDPNVGLQACWYGSFYSDVNYNHSPVPGQSPGSNNNSDQTVGIHLWYGAKPTTFNSAAWIYGDTVWTEQQEFDGYNGHAGVGCYSWGPGSNTYVFFVDMDSKVNILWKDLNESHPNTPSHPVHQWTKSNVTIPVFANSSLGYTNYLYVQNPDLSISGFNISWNAENTTLPPGAPQQPSSPESDASKVGVGAVGSSGDGGQGGNGFFTINGGKGLAGTHLSVTALPDKSGGNSLLAFYQTNGTDVTEFVRDFDAGQWTSSLVPIPDQ